MTTENSHSLERVYDRYLAWFHENANAAAQPKRRGELSRYCLGSEDIFEDSVLLLNRAFYFVPLLPSESKSGLLETFTISELNLMRKSGGPDGDDLTELVPVEYGSYT